jgi:hypothetical protein
METSRGDRASIEHRASSALAKDDQQVAGNGPLPAVPRASGSWSVGLLTVAGRELSSNRRGPSRLFEVLAPMIR